MTLAAWERPQGLPCSSEAMIMLDIDGFVTSPSFLSQIATLITSLIAALFSGIVNTLFGVSG